MAIQSNRPQNRIMLLGGVVLALIAGGLAFFALKGGGGGGGPTVSIIVAKQQIQAGSVLTSDNLQAADVPADEAPQDAVQSLTDAQNQTTPIDLFPNTPITKSLISAGQSHGNIQQGTHLNITKGYVAFAIPVKGTTPDTAPELVTIGYYIHPEDHIDILIDAGGKSPTDHAVRFAFQDVRVLAVGGAATPSQAAPASGAATTTAPAFGPITASYYVVELPRNQAEILTALITGRGGNNQGVIKYVLRPFDEYGKCTPPKNNPKACDGIYSYATYTDQQGNVHQSYEDNTGTPIPTVADSPATPDSLTSLFGH